MRKILDLKIGRNVYTVTNKSVFIDNGSCVQLITDMVDRYGFVWVTLTSKAIKEIGKFKRATIKQTHANSTSFMLLED